MFMIRVLLAEDEKDMSSALVAVLGHSGCMTDAVYDGAAAVEKARSASYDCMVFDIMMPRMDGLEALRRIRERGDMTPVIMLTAKAEVEDRIHGLDTGADDYLTKPFSMAELLARIRAAARRGGSFAPKTITCGKASLKVEEQELSGRSTIRLSGKETRLLKALMTGKGEALTRDELFRHIWKDEEKQDEDIVWIYISYLKEKLRAIDAGLTIEGDKEGPFLLKDSNC